MSPRGRYRGLLMKCLGERYLGYVLFYISLPSILGKYPSLPFTPLHIVKVKVKRPNSEFHNSWSGYAKFAGTRDFLLIAERVFA